MAVPGVAGTGRSCGPGAVSPFHWRATGHPGSPSRLGSDRKGRRATPPPQDAPEEECGSRPKRFFCVGDAELLATPARTNSSLSRPGPRWTVKAMSTSGRNRKGPQTQVFCFQAGNARKGRGNKMATLACCRCGQLIEPGQAWHLDHRDDRRGYLGPATPPASSARPRT